MTKQDVMDRLRALEPELRARGLTSLFLFGSAARELAHAESDVDLFFDYRGDIRFSLLDAIGVRHFLEAQLNKKVDLISRDSLHPLLRGDIEAEAAPVF